MQHPLRHFCCLSFPPEVLRSGSSLLIIIDSQVFALIDLPPPSAKLQRDRSYPASTSVSSDIDLYTLTT